MMILPVNPLKTDVKQNYRSSYIKSIEKYLDIGIISTQRQNSQLNRWSIIKWIIL